MTEFLNPTGHRRRRPRKLTSMVFYGIASTIAGDIEDWYRSRDEAETTLAAILCDEPDLEGELWVQGLDLETNPN